jgi:hypothetical protein
MKEINLLHSGIFGFLFMIISSNALSQVNFNIIPENSTMTIQGTSSLHDWHMEVTDLECSATLLMNEEHINSIRDTWFSCKTKSIISDYKLMDNKTYDALKADEFSKITFRMADTRDISLPGNKFTGNITGTLSIAGEVKEIDVPFRGQILAGDQLELEGKVPLKMSEFNIEPPTALMGTLKTGDEVWISYSLKLKKDIGKNPLVSTDTGSNNSE